MPKPPNEGRFLRLTDEARAKMWSGAKKTILVLVLLMMILLLFGGDFGLISLFRYRRFERHLEAQIEFEKARQDSLKEVLMRLNTDDEFKERLAREKLRMVRDGEVIYRFEDKKSDE